MWHDWEDERDLYWSDIDESLPAAVVKVDVEEGMGAFQFFKPAKGNEVAADSNGEALTLRCKGFLGEMKAESCLYRARKKARGFITIDFMRAKEAGLR